MSLPTVYRPEDVAERLGWSERRVRSEAKRLGACLIMGNRMRFTEADVEAIKNGTPVNGGGNDERKEPAVYFFAVRGFIKIGWSADWRGRLLNMQVSNPEPIEVLLVIGRPQIFEKTMHRKFAPFRARGEWFRDCAAIREYIESREDECWYRAGRRK